LRWGALAFLAKPFELQVLRAVVSEALAAEGV
jgi:FixJ family two-component response regulator